MPIFGELGIDPSGALGFATDFQQFRDLQNELLLGLAGGQTSVDAQAGAPVGNFTDQGLQLQGQFGVPNVVSFGTGTASPTFFPGAIGQTGTLEPRGFTDTGEALFGQLAANDFAQRQNTNTALGIGTPFGPTVTSSTTFGPFPGGQVPGFPAPGTVTAGFPPPFNPNSTTGGPPGQVATQPQGGLGGVLGGVFSGVSGALGGGGLGTLGGVLAAGGLLLGGASLLNRSGATSSSDRTTRTLPPPSIQELELLGINTSIALDQQRAFREFFNSALGFNEFSDQLFGLQTAEQIASAQALSPEARGQIDAGRIQREQALVPQEQQLQDQLLQDFLNRGQATPQELGFIGARADSTIQSGLSDLSRFRDETLNSIRLNSANRGLRPTDTPIANEFNRFGEDSARQAEQFIRGVRQQQLAESLNFPLQRGELGLRQFTAGQDALSRRRAFEAELADRTRQFRLNLGGLGTTSSLGLATGFNPTSPLGVLAQTRQAQGTVSGSSTPSTLQTGLGLAGAIGQLTRGQQAQGQINSGGLFG